MQTPGWSRDRLKDPASIELLIRVFGTRDQGHAPRMSEWERLSIVPLVFGLLPEAALVRERPDQRVKPIIVRHLTSLGIAATDELVTTLKRLADQYFESAPRPPLPRRQKLGVESVRALRLGTYSSLQARQGNRCAVCGARFGTGVLETLDHILPWRLAGDPHDGSNWQLLCDECNRGKREWLSALQSPQALNWFYGFAEEWPTRTTLETRYLTLVLAGKCQVADCDANPKTSRLELTKRLPTGLPVLDNIVVRCEQHVADGTQVITAAHSPDTARVAREGTSILVEVEATPPTDASSHAAQEPEPERFGEYVLTSRVVSAGMAECFRAVVEETGERVFLKRVREDGPDIAALQREAEIYQKLERRSAEHTVRVHDFARKDGFQVLVLDCAEYDLEDYVTGRNGLPTNEAKAVASEIIDGLRELHDAQIVHRDLKPRNVLRCGGRWVLADFGISKDTRVVGGGRTFRQMGTTGYAAPEQLMTGHEAAPAADVYAFGKVVVFLLTAATDVDRVLLRKWRTLVRRCTADEPDRRPGLGDVSAELEQIDE